MYESSNIPPTMGQIVVLPFFYKDGFYIISPMNIVTPLNKEVEYHHPKNNIDIRLINLSQKWKPCHN